LKYLLLITALLAAVPAAAQVQYFSAGKKAPIDGAEMQQPADAAADPSAVPPPQTRIVTSLQKCLNQLEPEEQAIVRSNYEKQYQTCNAMLAEKGRKAKSARKKKEAAEAEEPEAENARNYVRVRESTAEEDEAAEPDSPAESDEPAPRKRRKKEKGSWLPEIKPSKSRASFND